MEVCLCLKWEGGGEGVSVFGVGRWGCVCVCWGGR